MHSCRMRTVRCSDGGGGGVSQHALSRGVCPSMHWVGGVAQHALGRGCLLQGGCLPRGCLPHNPPPPCGQNS